MSAEVRKDAGRTAPNTPLEPQGCLPGFLRRFFAEPRVAQPTLKIIQPPLGLEDLAVKIQQGIEGRLSEKRQQQELARQQAEKIFAGLAIERAQIEAKQNELAEQQRIRIEKALSEADKILKDFQIRQTLEYILHTTWEDIGEIKPIEPDFNKQQNRLGGFVLEYSYGTTYIPIYMVDRGFDVQEEVKGPELYSTERTWLKIIVEHMKVEDSSEDDSRKLLRIESPFLGESYYHGNHVILDLSDLTDMDRKKEELKEIFIRESVSRKLHKGLPSHLFLEGSEKQKRLANSLWDRKK